MPSIFHRHPVPQSSQSSASSSTTTRPLDVPVTPVSASPGASGCDGRLRKRSSSTTSSCDPAVGTSVTVV